MRLSGPLLHSAAGFPGEADVVDLEDHPDQLRGERDLLLLRQQRLDDVLRLHVVRPLLQAVDAQSGILVFHLYKRHVREFRNTDFDQIEVAVEEGESRI